MNPRLLALASIREGLKSFLDDKRFKGARENFCKREGLKKIMENSILDPNLPPRYGKKRIFF